MPERPKTVTTAEDYCNKI